MATPRRRWWRLSVVAAIAGGWTSAVAALEPAPRSSAHHGVPLLQAGARRGGPRPPEFFEDQKLWVAPPVTLAAEAKTCHPMCFWSCGKAECRDKCKPVCKAPKCETACQKPKISQCKTICEDPQCAVVCPSGPQCENSGCPECKTVCGEPKCRLDCGQGRVCRTTCADPECRWDCSPEGCPKPECKLTCTQPNCPRPQTKEPTLREVYAGYGGGSLEADKGHAVQYLNREVGWTGLAKVPEDVLAPGAVGAPGANLAGGAIPIGGAGVPDGAAPRGDEACASFCKKGGGGNSTAGGGAAAPCACGIEATAKVNPRVKWVIVARTP